MISTPTTVPPMPPMPAGKTCAANHDRRDRVELVADAGARLSGVEAGREDHARKASGQRAERVDDQCRLAHVDAGEPRDLGAAADCIERPARRAVREDNPGDHDDRDHHRDRHGEEPEMADDREIGEPIGKADDLLAIGDDAGDAAGDRHHGERRDESGHVEARDHEPRRHAAERGGDQRGHNRDPERPAEIVAEIAHHHAGQRQHRADREVDAADQDDQSHADRHDAEHRDLIEDVQEVSQRQERLGRHRQEDAEKNQADQRTRCATDEIQGADAPSRLHGHSSDRHGRFLRRRVSLTKPLRRSLVLALSPRLAPTAVVPARASQRPCAGRTVPSRD